MSGEKEGVAILGVFVADLAFRAGRLPAMLGEPAVIGTHCIATRGRRSVPPLRPRRTGRPIPWASRAAPIAAMITTAPSSRMTPGSPDLTVVSASACP